jgi:hypothetical protein
MKDPKRFYTYAYLREDGSPYYVGKGNGVRLYKKSRKEIRPPKDISRILFLKQNLTEEEAFKHEKYMIAVFGRKDLGEGILHNKTNGGEGSSGLIVTEETKKKLSKINSGKNHPQYGKPKSEEARRKISENNRNRSQEIREKIRQAKLGEKNWFYGRTGEAHPMFGRKLSDETRKKLSEIKKGQIPSSVTLQKAKEKLKGSIYINDGNKCKRIQPTETIPEGWVKGRGKFIRKRKNK